MIPSPDPADQTARMAVRLTELGLGNGDRLEIVLPDGPEMAGAFRTLAAELALLRDCGTSDLDSLTGSLAAMSPENRERLLSEDGDGTPDRHPRHDVEP